MRRFAATILLAVGLAGCGPVTAVTAEHAATLLSTPSPLATQFVSPRPPTPVPTEKGTPTPDEFLNAQVTMIFAQATNTQIAIQKTEAAAEAERSTQAYFVDMTMAALTQEAIGTMESSAGATSTQAYWDDITQTPLAATQQVELAELTARKVSIWGGLAALFSFAGLSWWLIWKLAKIGIEHLEKRSRAEYLQRSNLARDTSGQFGAMPSDALGRGVKLIVPDLAHRAVIDPLHDDLTADQALRNAMHLHEIQMMGKIAPALFGKSRRRPMDGDVLIEKGPGKTDLDHRLPETMLPEWSALDHWTPDGRLPFGMSADGLMALDPNTSDAHPLVAGKTGSGKTYFFMRPFGAIALASGWQVIICGDLIGYHPFEGHPNAYLFPYENEGNEQRIRRVIQYLRNANAELSRRKSILYQLKASLWSPQVGPRVMLLVDEFSNMCEGIAPELRDELYEQGRMIVREGRKTGLHLAMTVHDATRDYFDIAIRRQMTPVAFRLGDDHFSRVMVNSSGAAALPDRHFMTIMMGSRSGVAFAPTDAEIAGFLGRLSAVAQPAPEWIEGDGSPSLQPLTVPSSQSSSIPSSQPSITPSPQPSPTGRGGDAILDIQIWSMYMGMRAEGRVNLAQIQRAVFGDVNTGGANFNRIKAVIERYSAAEEATTAATTGNLAESGPAPA